MAIGSDEHDENLALIGIEAALLAAVDIGNLIIDLDDDVARLLDDALYLSTSSAVLLACAGPHHRACLDRLLALGVLAWDDLGRFDARRGVSDGFDAQQRRVFALVSKAGADDLSTLGARVHERLGGKVTEVLSTTLMVVTRLIWGVAEVMDTDGQGALEALRRMPGDSAT